MVLRAGDVAPMDKQIRKEVASTLSSLRRNPRRKLGLVKVFDEERAEKTSPKSHERFERYVLSAFKKAGLNYDDLINLPAGAVEAAFALYVEGDLTWAQSATELLSQVSK